MPRLDASRRMRVVQVEAFFVSNQWEMLIVCNYRRASSM